MEIFNQKEHSWLVKLRQESAFWEEHGEKTGRFPYENINRLKEMGYTKITLPKELGGNSATLYEFVMYQEQLAKYDGPTALCIGWHVGIVKELVENQRWNMEMFQWICEEVKKGALINRAASERNTGSPTRGGIPETIAVLDGEEWVVTGRKIFTTLAPIADYLFVSARIGESDEIGDFIIPMKNAGITIEETWDSIAMSTTGSHDVVFQEVRIPRAFLVENLSQSRKENPKTNGWLLHIPACYLGIAAAARDEALHFATTYTPNSINKPICELPNVQVLIGEMDLLLYQARATLYHVAQSYDQSDEPLKLVPELGAAKHIVTNTCIDIVDKAMRIVGLRGLSNESKLQRYYKNIRAGLHNPPMDDAVIKLLAKRAISQVKM